MFHNLSNGLVWLKMAMAARTIASFVKKFSFLWFL
jgi:hypothetical protein